MAERIVYQAKLEKKIPPTGGIEEGLSELAERREFTDILELEAEASKLHNWDVLAAFDTLYHESKYSTNGDDGANIIVKETEFRDTERAALVCLLKLQSSWPCPLAWKEELHEFPKGDK
ncbi:hypothetical protein B9Z19DRAFT_1069422 [Tuber borchii]|uniref:Uncharacterized protein n=1 Tax=Tuber borchii TaxID=42251 RepID=A0A2T6ZBM3_TUBBO|nr:hypothetical protein B9Z19DRAFT_1069422 [Tuber borchii]